MKYALISLLLILCALPLLAKEWNQYYFRFQIQDRSELQALTSVVSIDQVRGNTVWAYANDTEWAEFGKLGYRAELLPAPASEFPAIMSANQSQLRLWDSYPTYDAYVAMMNAFAANYPSLCTIVDAGTTVNGRKILFARISDNVATHEQEPEVLFTSSMHGDEITGYVLMLRLIDTLLSQYGTDTRITNLVNNLEIWINPNANPDGTYYGGNSTVANARRYNYNGYDINRNFPDPNGNQYSGQPLQTETSLMMNLANSHHFALSANFHGGAEVVNYPWDYTYSLHPDDSWWLDTSLDYANSVQANGPAGYFTSVSDNGVTNGADWYVITGGRQDWHNYTARGRELTVEISNTKAPSASTLPNYWNYNYNAFLGFLEQAYYGIHGTVRDAWGNPLAASITVVGHDSNLTTVNTDPAHGDFYRFLSPGTWSLLVESSGYPSQTVNVAVAANQATTVNIVFGEIPNAQEIALSAGWNLVSLNVVPSSYAVDSVFGGINSVLQIKNETRSYAPEQPMYLNTLATLAPGEAYWVNLSSPATLTVQGPVIDPSAIPISLKAGWNLVAYLPENALPVATALSSISAWLQEVRYFGDSYVPGSARNALTQLEPGKGYWIRVSQACTLSYPD